MSDEPQPDIEPDGNQDENTNGVPGGDPKVNADVERSGETVDRLKDHGRQADDPSGTNPNRSQTAI